MLHVNYGYFADVDIGSERLRLLGNARFEVYGYMKLLKLNKYEVEIIYP